MDGFQVRWCLKIEVETAAGAVFLPTIKPELWVRRDGLSIDFHAGEPPTSRILPTWASVSAEQGPKEKMMKPTTAATLAQGDLEVEAGRRAGWAALLTGKKLTRGTKGQLFERQHCRTALGRQG